MSLFSRVHRTLRQRNGRFFFSAANSQQAHTFIVASRIYRDIYASTGALTPEGFHCFGRRSQVWASGQSSYASGLRAIHSMASSNYLQLGHHRDNARKINDYNFKAVSMVSHRSFSGDSVLWTLIGANLLVYGMWYKLDYEFMKSHFVVSFNNAFLRGRVHTLLTAAFSHMKLDHLFFNLLGLYIFGRLIGREFGGEILLGLYIAGGIFGSFGHIFYYGVVLPFIKGFPIRPTTWGYMPAALGASGAVSTITILYMLMHPNALILFYFLIPMPAALAGSLLVGIDLYRALTGKADVSPGAHLAGACLAGFLWLRHG